MEWIVTKLILCYAYTYISGFKLVIMLKSQHFELGLEDSYFSKDYEFHRGEVGLRQDCIIMLSVSDLITKIYLLLPFVII